MTRWTRDGRSRTQMGVILCPATPSLGKSDPYCEVTMGAQVFTSRTLNDTLNPKWNFNCQFHIKDIYQDVLCITIFERDQFSPDGQFQDTLVHSCTSCSRLSHFIWKRSPRPSWPDWGACGDHQERVWEQGSRDASSPASRSPYGRSVGPARPAALRQQMNPRCPLPRRAHTRFFVFSHRRRDSDKSNTD